MRHVLHCVVSFDSSLVINYMQRVRDAPNVILAQSNREI